MAVKTGIEWTDATWSPLRVRVRMDAVDICNQRGWKDLAPIVARMTGRAGPHCESVGPGCAYCYSDTNNHRCLPANGTGLPFDRRSRELVEPFIDEKIGDQPFNWKAPRRIFVENQSDLFGEWWPDEFIARVFNTMAECPQHTFQVLTKRAERMARILGGPKHHHLWTPKMWHREVLPNVWLGVSVENQEYADKRIPLLLQTPAAVRFVSYEPALGPVNFMRRYGKIEMSPARMSAAALEAGAACEFVEYVPRLDWIIIGGESGPKAREFNLEWARETVRQCKAAGVACFVKQMGSNPFLHMERSVHEERPGLKFHMEQLEIDRTISFNDGHGGDPSEWPADLRVREFPEARS